MKEFLEIYGELPENLGYVNLDTDSAEMCFVQYLPILIPNQVGQLPENVVWCKPLIERAYDDLVSIGQDFCYMYLTVKRLYGSGNREGWHCDGFGTDDINYIWYDSHPTEFFQGKMALPKDHKESINYMNSNIRETNNNVMYMCKHLIRMTQSSIHRVNPEPFTGLRTFIKISVSDSKYNLKGNAHNYGLDYSWKMQDRGADRNDPIGEGI